LTGGNGAAAAAGFDGCQRIRGPAMRSCGEISKRTHPMSTQGLEMIEHTVQLTHEWINDLAERLDWADKRQVLMLLRSTLTALRDLLSVNEAAQFSAQLPLLIRGLFYENWTPASRAERTATAFVERVSEKLAMDAEYRGEEDIAEVFRLLNARISQGEVEDIRQSLPADIRRLWPG
jgi:uncharacterized protein (DUF2267 family)